MWAVTIVIKLMFQNRLSGASLPSRHFRLFIQPSEFSAGQPTHRVIQGHGTHTSRLSPGHCVCVCVPARACTYVLHTWLCMCCWPKSVAFSFSYPLFPGIGPEAITTKIWLGHRQQQTHAHTHTLGQEENRSTSLRPTFPLYCWIE